MDKCDNYEKIDYMMAVALISSLYKKGIVSEEIYRKIEKQSEKKLKKFQECDTNK